jgi:hypothetical protein
MKYLPSVLALITCLALSAGCGDDTDAVHDTGTTEDAAALTDTASSDTDTTDAGPADDDTGLADANPETGGGTDRDGLEGFCDHYVDCGGTYYEDAADCVGQSIDYWGECRRAELDTFGDCMKGLTCDEWGDPDVYNPANTDCAEEWSAVQQASCE